MYTIVTDTTLREVTKTKLVCSVGLTLQQPIVYFLFFYLFFNRLQSYLCAINAIINILFSKISSQNQTTGINMHYVSNKYPLSEGIK